MNAGDWFNNAISTLSNAGIVTGYNDGTFRPNQPITRGEMAKIIANFANLNKGTKSFTDLSGHWSKTYVELAAGNGWIAGYPDGSFRPDQKITRAETVTMINRVLERVPAKELRLLSRSIMLTFPDTTRAIGTTSPFRKLPTLTSTREASMRPRATKCGPS